MAKGSLSILTYDVDLVYLEVGGYEQDAGCGVEEEKEEKLRSPEETDVN